MSIFNIIPDQPKEPSGSMMEQLLNMPAPESSPLTPPPTGLTPSVQDPIVVQGDNWKPTHRNLLGRIADAMLMGQGRKPVYEQRMRERDLNSAMQDFDPDNPMQTIRRIAKIPGMGDEAYKMYQDYSTNKERNQSRDIRDAAKKDLIFQRLGAMAGAANEKNFPHMHKLMVDYVKRWGENPDDYDIPPEYDRDQLDAFSGGAISAKDQRAQELQQQGLALRGEAISNTEEYRNARLGQIDRQETGRNSRFQQKEAGIQTRFQTNQGRLVNNKTTRTLMTKYGPGMISPDGQHMIVTRGDKRYGYAKVGVANGKDNWVPLGPLKNQ